MSRNWKFPSWINSKIIEPALCATGCLEDPTPQRCWAGRGGYNCGPQSGWPGETLAFYFFHRTCEWWRNLVWKRAAVFFPACHAIAQIRCLEEPWQRQHLPLEKRKKENDLICKACLSHCICNWMPEDSNSRNKKLLKSLICASFIKFADGRKTPYYTCCDFICLTFLSPILRVMCAVTLAATNLIT